MNSETLKDIAIEFRKNYIWFITHYKELEKKYLGEYVAVANESIIEHSKSEKIRKKYWDRPEVYIDLITPSDLVWLL